jgi:hypothetical protein
MTPYRETQRATPGVNGARSDRLQTIEPAAERPSTLAGATVSVESWLGRHFYATLAIGVSCGVVLGWLIKRRK